MTNRNKNILLGVLIVGVISMTVAFAALSTNLRINGTTNVAATRWNIHFQQWALDTQSTITVNGNTQHNTAEYPQVNQLTMQDNSNVTKVSGINVTLHQPNDYVRYTFQIINEGTIDADLQGFTHNLDCESGKTCEFMEYEVNCYDNASLTGTALTTNSTLTANGGLAYCYLQVKYKDITNGDISKTNTANKVQASVAGTDQRYTQSATSATLSAQWTWVQATQANNNQGGNSGGSGNNEPISRTYPVPERCNDWGYDGCDYGSSDWIVSNSALGQHYPNQDWAVYVIEPRSEQNPETGMRAVCAKFINGTACFSAYYGEHDNASFKTYNEATEEYELSDYGNYVINDFESKGAECSYDFDKINCSDSIISCEIEESYATCGNGNGSCSAGTSSVSCTPEWSSGEEEPGE